MWGRLIIQPLTGGRQSIHDGGISTGTIIESGNQDVYKGGISNGTTIKGGTSRIEGGLQMEQSLMVEASQYQLRGMLTVRR